MVSRNRRTTTAASRRSGQTQKYKTPALVGAALVCVCVAVAVVVTGLSALWHGVADMKEFRVRPGDVRIENPWVKSEALMTALRSTDPTGLLSTECSLFDRDLARRVAQGYNASPWVRNVVTVSKVFPNRLSIEIELREPHAVIRCVRDGRHYCVDRDGVVLDPGIYRLTRKRLAPILPLLVAHDTQTAPASGRRWADLTVQEGIKMLRLYRRQFEGQMVVKEIEIKQVTLNDGTHLADAWLVLDTGTRIFWGHTPSALVSAAEESPGHKTAALRALIKKEGAQLGQRKMIDLRWKQPRME